MTWRITLESWLLYSVVGAKEAFPQSRHILRRASGQRRQGRDAPFGLGNSSGKWTRQQVIQWIEAKTHTFFTLVNGKRADIGVVNGPNGKYLRTYADGVWNDNLLALAECP